jgi:hypothetical protein
MSPPCPRTPKKAPVPPVIVRLSSNSKPHYYLALIYERKRAYEEAVAEWAKVLRLEGRGALAT